MNVSEGVRLRRSTAGLVAGRRLPAALLALLACLGLATSSAHAATHHTFSASFGATGSGAGQLSLARPDYSFNLGVLTPGSGIAVNDETHDIYVADTANHRVDQFSAAGAFIRAWGWGVATGAAEFQTCTATCLTGLPGSAPGQFQSPLSIAIDNSGGLSKGDVYVADTRSIAGPGTNLIQKFDSSGNLITSWGGGGQLDGSAATGGPFSGEIAGIATDSAGNLFVNNLNRYVFKFAPDGTAAPSIPINGSEYPSGIAIDPSGAGNFYRAANGNGQIDRLDSAGNSLTTIEPVIQLGGIPYQSTGFAVDPLAGDLYSGHGSLIRHYAIDSSGNVVESDGSLCPSFCPATDAFGAGVVANAAGLAVDPSPSTVYVADAGEDRVLIFPTAAEADTKPASNVQRDSATLNGHLDPAGGSSVVGCHLEYLSDQAFKANNTNEVQTLTLTGATAGTFTLTFRGQTTTAIPATAPASEVRSALTKLKNVEVAGFTDGSLGGVSVTGPNGGPYKVEFTNALARLDVPQLTANSAALLPSGATVTPATITTGGNGWAAAPTASCAQGNTFPSPADVSAAITGLASQTEYHSRLVVTNEAGLAIGSDQTFTTPPAVTALHTDAATDVAKTTATLHGSFTAEEGIDTHYYFLYGTSSGYGHKAPIPAALLPAPASTENRGVSTPVEHLAPGATYHFRIVAENHFGTTVASNEETFSTSQGPAIQSFSSSNVAATSADLEAKIDPQQFATTYRFEYGTTPEYGQSAPVPDGEIDTELFTPHQVEVHLSGLQRGVTYHFRVIASSHCNSAAPGEECRVATEDQSFQFFPPSCPNSAARQQTGAAYLPDCRAYELVSPGNANGTLLSSGGPNPGTATSPSRFAYTGSFSSLPGAGETIGTSGDLYVATRTTTGWVSKYIGLPGHVASCMSGPPNHPWSHSYGPDKIQNFVLTDPSMSRFLDWSVANAGMCLAGGNGTGDAGYAISPSSNAPYLWNAEGVLLANPPSNLGSVSGAVSALRCPVVTSSWESVPNAAMPSCSGDVAASGDLTHFVLSSSRLSFSEPAEPAGLTHAPGSVYDNNLATGQVTLISTLPGGNPIPQDPTYLASAAKEEAITGVVPEEFIRIPAVSTDGSHILMSTATATTPLCSRATVALVCPRFTDNPIHLYMSIDDEPAIEVSKSETTGEDVAVNYVGTIPSGSKVFFTSAQQLIAADDDTSVDLYMWSQAGEEAGHPLALLSKADNESNSGEAGNTDECHAAPVKEYGSSGTTPQGEGPWTPKCGVLPFSNWSYAHLNDNAGGNGRSDVAITPAGNIYFYSPEQLDGDLGVPGAQNLYDYREGGARFVASLDPEKHCQGGTEGEGFCTEGPIARLQVAADDSRMAFVTQDRLTSYDNAGHLEMYRYTAATGAIICVSCRPDGKAPTGDVAASQDGLFLTDDGRVFFSTKEPLIPYDTNEGTDVYEFVDGRPQLISTGTGTGTLGGSEGVIGSGEKTIREVAGLVGVSADGTDAYFSTFDTLTAEDHNGNFLKFYDARVGGGFAQPAPRQPCAAAEECHGAGTEAPQLPTQATAARLTGGNVKGSGRHKTHRKRKAHRKRQKGRRGKSQPRYHTHHHRSVAR